MSSINLKTSSAPSTRRINGIISFLHSKFVYFTRHALLHLTLITIITKSFLFLGLINGSNPAKIDFTRVFYFGVPFFEYFAFISALLTVTFLFKGRKQLWAILGLNTLMSLLIVMDLMYFRGFGNFVSLHLLKQTTNLDNLGSSVLSMLRPVDLVFFVDIAVILFVVIRNKSLCKNANRHPFLFVALFSLSVAYLGFAHYKYDVVEQGQNKMVFRVCWAPNQTMSNLSPVGYHIYDTYVFWKDNQELKLSPPERDEINAWFAAKKENLPDNRYKAMFKGKNLLMVQVESLENFVINQKINNQEITPNLNRLLKNSLYFSNFHEQVWNGTTSDAELIANTSVFPVRRGSTFFRYPNNTYNSLPRLLKDQGYETLAIHPDKGSYWNWRQALTSFGFAKTFDVSSFNVDETIGLGLSDGSYLRQVAPLLNEQKQPFYTFMITLSSHSPFDLPKQFRELSLEQSLDDTKLGGYFQGIHYTDKQLGLFLQKLDQSGLLDNTVVVFYGDHEGVHKFYQDEVDQIKPAEDWWLNNHSKVPLIIYQKGLKGEELATIGGQIDILPTVSYLLGIEDDVVANTAMGRNLLKTTKNYAILANGKPAGRLYNPEETKNLTKSIEFADKIVQSNFFKDLEQK